MRIAIKCADTDEYKQVVEVLDSKYTQEGKKDYDKHSVLILNKEAGTYLQARIQVEKVLNWSTDSKKILESI